MSESSRNPCAIVVPNGLSVFGVLHVNVNPLVVTSSVGEQIDALLVNGDPVAEAEVCADRFRS